MKVSIKSVNITPPIGMQMAGYSERTHGATGVHDPLMATSIVIDDGQNKIAYAIVDVVGIDGYVSQAVRDLVANQTDIKPECIMIGAIHTHSSVYACRLKGQNFLPTEQFDELSDEAYYQQFIQKIAGSIVWANNTLEDGKIGFGYGAISGLGTNRNNPKAYYDNKVGILKIEDCYGNLKGILINHACHPTVLTHDNYLFSADYVGYVRSHLQAYYPNIEVVYSQGAAGSASTRYTKKDNSFEEANRLSQIIVGEVIKVLPTIQTTDDIKVSGAILPLDLDVKEFPSDEDCLQQIADYEQQLEKLKAEKAPEQEIRRMYVTLQGAQRNYVKKQNIQITKVQTQLQLLDFKVCTIIGIPADCFGEIARDIQLLSNDKNILVAGYTNDFLSYIVSKEGYAMDCYEKNMTIVTEKAHDEIVNVANQLLKKQSD